MLAGILILFLTAAGLFLLLSYLNAFDKSLLIQEYQVHSEKIDLPLTAAVLTDLHSNYYGEAQQELLAALMAAAPDLILMAGDLADRDIPMDGFLDLLAGLPTKIPTYFVTGNHEFWSGKVSWIKAQLREQGITVLEGTCAQEKIHGQTLEICGLDDPTAGRKEFSRQVDQLPARHTAEPFSILLFHCPEHDKVKQLLPLEFDLILSGHAHGGQWRIPRLLNGVFAPNQWFFPKYAGGYYRHDRTVQIVSRGLAKDTTKIPRIFNRPELVILKIDKSAN